MTNYVEFIVVEGFPEELAGKMKLGEFELIDLFEEYGYRAYGHLDEYNVLSKVRIVLEGRRMPFLCFRRMFSLEGGQEENKEILAGILNDDCTRINVAFRLLSSRLSDAKVVFGTCFDKFVIDDEGTEKTTITDSRKAGFSYLPFMSLDCKTFVSFDVCSPEQQQAIFSQVCKYLDGSASDPRKQNIIWQFYGSMFGPVNQRFMSMTICFEMLLIDYKSSKKIPISRIVAHLLDDDTKAEDDIVAMYEVRNAYVHEGNPGGIAQIFPRTYELLVKVIRVLLDESIDIADLQRYAVPEKKSKVRD